MRSDSSDLTAEQFVDSMVNKDRNTGEESVDQHLSLTLAAVAQM